MNSNTQTQNEEDNDENVQINSNNFEGFLEYVVQEVNEDDGIVDDADGDVDFLLEDENNISDQKSDDSQLNNIVYVQNDNNEDEVCNYDDIITKPHTIADTNNYENDEEYLMEYLIEEDAPNEANDVDIKIESFTNEHSSNDDSNDNELYHCSSCDIRFTSVSDHINLFHKQEEVMVEIDDISKKLGEKQIMLKEQKPTRKLPQVDIFKCKQCNHSFNSVESLSAHMAVHRNKYSLTLKKNPNPIKNNDKSKKYMIKPRVPSICSICNTLFNSEKSLKLHFRMHVQASTTKQSDTVLVTENAAPTDTILNNSNIFYCELCDKRFDKKFEEIHLKTHISSIKPHVCTTCNKRFSTEDHLLMHLNAHSDPREIKTKASKLNIRLPYPCQYCGKEFSRPHEKVKHERIHTGEKPHSCDICGKTFRVSYCLTLHKRTHTDDRPYVCPHCNKRYKAQSVYNHHLMTHSSVRGYQCPFCPKSFKTAVQLSGHKNSHTKPFTCTECNRPFATLFAVKAHIESHKRLNHNLKHSCSICGASYARGFALKDHIKEQHPDCELNGDFNVTDDLVDGNTAATTVAAISSNILDNFTEINVFDNDDDDDDDDDITVPVTTLNYFDVINVVGDNDIDDQEANVRIEDVTTNDDDDDDDDDEDDNKEGIVLELNDFIRKEISASSGDIVTEEVTISEIEHYENEEVVTDWMMK